MRILIKRILLLISINVLLINSVKAECNPKTDIYEDSKTGRFSYSLDCHLEFGKLRQTDKDRQEQIAHLEKAIQMKDLALDIADKRIENWKDATYKMEDRILKLEKTNDNMKALYFGLGIIVTGLAVWGAGQLK